MGQRLFLRVLWRNYYGYDRLRIGVEISPSLGYFHSSGASASIPTPSPVTEGTPSSPTGAPSLNPTDASYSYPSGMPTCEPTRGQYPSGMPTSAPTEDRAPSGHPTLDPTTLGEHTVAPSMIPIYFSSSAPTSALSNEPSSFVPSNVLSLNNLPEVQLIRLSFVNQYEQQQIIIQGKFTT